LLLQEECSLQSAEQKQISINNEPNSTDEGPTEKAFNKLITFVAVHNFEQALCLIKTLHKEIKIGSTTFYKILKFYCKGVEEDDKVKALLATMEECKVPINIDIYNKLIEYYGEHNFEQALQYFIKMRKEKNKTNFYKYQPINSGLQK